MRYMFFFSNMTYSCCNPDEDLKISLCLIDKYPFSVPKARGSHSRRNWEYFHHLSTSFRRTNNQVYMVCIQGILHWSNVYLPTPHTSCLHFLRLYFVQLPSPAFPDSNRPQEQPLSKASKFNSSPKAAIICNPDAISSPIHCQQTASWRAAISRPMGWVQ